MEIQECPWKNENMFDDIIFSQEVKFLSFSDKMTFYEIWDIRIS